jgi:hypothetical protein
MILKQKAKKFAEAGLELLLDTRKVPVDFRSMCVGFGVCQVFYCAVGIMQAPTVGGFFLFLLSSAFLKILYSSHAPSPPQEVCSPESPSS